MQHGDVTREISVAASATASGPARTVSGTFESSGASQITPGSVLSSRYEILKLLGEGGMGAVYKARDRELDRLVALKVIRPELVGNPAILQRFKQELILARQVTHRNVTRIYDLGEADGIKFITMEFIEGEDLRSILRHRGKLSPTEAADTMRQVLNGLAAAHAEGVIHRDLKPGNIMRDEHGRVVVMDFGLARSVQTEGLTETGLMLGTLEYMSPEQARAQDLEASSDLYTVGLIFYELLSGRMPFKAESAVASLLKRAQERAAPVSSVESSVPERLSKIVGRCLEADHKERYQHAQQVISDLDAWEGRASLADRFVSPAARRRRWILAAVALLVVSVAIGVWRWMAPRAPGAGHAPVAVLVADFNNLTGDGVFEGTLEPSFSLALEGASFISSYSRGGAHKIAAQIKPGSTVLDEALARLVAVREGINVVISGEVARAGSGFKISAKAMDAVTGNVIARADADSASKEAVLRGVSTLAAGVRRALGDSTPESVQLAQAETFTAKSLEAAHEYARAQELLWAGKWEESTPHYLEAVRLDPDLGRAYAGLAAVKVNSGQPQEGEKYFRLALAHLDRMTEREKYRTRGGYYTMRRESDKAIEEYSALLKQYPADEAARTNLALNYFYLRDMKNALEEGRRAVELSPRNLLDRNNLALYAVYAGDFAAAVEQAQAVLKENPKYVNAYGAIAMGLTGQGKLREAGDMYARMAAVSPRGASMAAVGLADLALLEGHSAAAAGGLENTIAADLRENNPDAAAAKLLLLAEAEVANRQPAAGLRSAERALALSRQYGVIFSAGEIYVSAKRRAKATALAAELQSRLDPEAQLYGKLLEGEVALDVGDLRKAITLFQVAQKLADSWLGRFDLAKSYLAASMYTEADSELEVCLKRRGETSALFLDDVPTFRIMPLVYYYLGRAQEGLGSPAAAESYKSFLAMKEKGDEDALVADARKRTAHVPR